MLASGLVAALCFTPRAGAQTPTTLLVDDFESGVTSWTRNDKAKASGGTVVLADIVSTGAARTGGPTGSKSAALVAFKSGQNTWASVSRPVDGAAWAKLGAERLTFWLDAGGETPGVSLQLRGRYPGPNGTSTEIVFSLPRPIRLDLTRWRRVVIPLSDFKGPKGQTLEGRLGGLYLLQFLQTGTWDSRFFTLDDIRVEGSGVPVATPTPVPTPSKTPAPAPTTAPSGSIAVNVDFLRLAGKIRASGNLSIGASNQGPNVLPIESSPQYRQSLALVKPRFIRLDAGGLCDLVDSATPNFDFSRLQRAVARAAALNAEPLVAISNPAEWGLDTRGYAIFATSVAKILNRKGAPPVRYFELAATDASLDDASAASYYNTAYSALKTLSRNFRVGGYSSLASNTTAQTVILRNAKGLDFLTVGFYGANTEKPSDADLLQAAREVPSLKTVAGLLDKSKFRNAPIFVTTANLNANRNPGEVVPTDIRTQQVIAASWWAQFLASGSRLADQVFHNDAVNPEWGLLTQVGTEYRAYPAYYSIWMWNTYFPSGSDRVTATSASPDVFVSACNTPTAHNVLLTNTTNREQTAQVAIRGFPVLREARIRIFDDPEKSVNLTTLPKSPFQTVKLAPYAVAVIQFIEPPKKK
jgi:hypothetical protein